MALQAVIGVKEAEVATAAASKVEATDKVRTSDPGSTIQADALFQVAMANSNRATVGGAASSKAAEVTRPHRPQLQLEPSMQNGLQRGYTGPTPTHDSRTTRMHERAAQRVHA